MIDVVFVVEEAGCESCAARVRAALEPLGTVGEVEIDEQTDAAAVRLTGAGIDEDAVGAALAAASEGSGHGYRIRPSSWRVT